MYLRSALLAAVAASPCLAQSESTTPLDPVVVTATRSAQPVNRLPAALIVITREEIERSSAAHLVEVLRARAGVEVIDAYGDGSRTLVGLRGFGENAHSNTLILVNGRKLNNPDIGAPDLNAIALQDIERIEIVQGSVGALLGDQAVGGVINIITRATHGSGASIHATGGSYATAGVRASAAHRWDTASVRVAALGRYGDNYREHNALNYENFSARGDFGLGAGDAFLELQHVDERLQTPGALLGPEVRDDRRQSHPDFSGDFNNTQTTAATLGTHWDLGARWALEVDASRRESDGRFRLSFRGAPATQDATQDRRVSALSPRLTGTFPVAAGSIVLTAGVDAQRSEYRLLSSIGPQSNDQVLLDGYLQAVVPFASAIELVVAGRAARVENDLADGFVFPAGGEIDDSEDALALGLSWRPAPALRTFVRYDENYRFAKVDEFFGSTFTPGVVNLRTQTGRSHEVGADWSGTRTRLTALLYRLDLNDELVFDPSTFTNANLPRTRRSGALLEATLAPAAWLDLAASYTYVDAQVVSGSLRGKSVPLVPRQVGRLSARLMPSADWAFGAELQGTGRRAFSGDFDNSLAPLPGHAVVNATAQYRPGRWRLDARVNNLLGHRYSELGSETFLGEASYFPSPELNGWLGAGFEF